MWKQCDIYEYTLHRDLLLSLGLQSLTDSLRSLLSCLVIPQGNEGSNVTQNQNYQPHGGAREKSQVIAKVFSFLSVWNFNP